MNNAPFLANQEGCHEKCDHGFMRASGVRIVSGFRPTRKRRGTFYSGSPTHSGIIKKSQYRQVP